ncbi:type II toxin-antitoxin system death-on-curing family toxin [Verrucomicrobia bacterium]|nr:type II toxin-antitoxin system death-on-curing family toxin [Verrucomicrobiota bacterium]
MKEPVWILPETVFALQERLLSEFGGLSGLREMGLLQSALARPQQQYSLGETNLFLLAAAYAYSLIQNHPFHDGNKRIGFTVAVLFIEMNGFHFVAKEAHSTLNTLALAAGEMTYPDYAEWLKTNSI